jgi:polyisoprenoid-binding protein YceI
MNSITVRRMAILSTVVLVLISFRSQGQDRYAQKGTSTISIAGTSTMHDWTMTSKEATYDAVFETDAQGNPVKLTSLTVSVRAESLKSEKHGMDKNAYSALKTDKNEQITFQLLAGRVDRKNVACDGKLTIAGTTKQINVDAAYTVLAGGSLQFKGTKKIVMTDYNVEPPSFMFGTVKTGDEITVSFDVTLAPGKLQSNNQK